MVSSRRLGSPVPAALAGLALLGVAVAGAQGEMRRTASGRPDLSGFYDAATLTPLQRPPEYGDNLLMTREEAARIARERAEFSEHASRRSDSERSAPSVGGAPAFGFEDDPEAAEALGAGRVGGYNWFWTDQGSGAFDIDGEFRTSIITDPKDGQMPPMTTQGRQRMEARVAAFRHPNTGTAWWLGRDFGPYDDIEQRPLAERCLLSRNRSGPPILPGLYNNVKRIVQTEDAVMILAEQIHDARVIRIGGEHPPEQMRFWMGDSIARWEGDVLVVETTNFRPYHDLSARRRVVERFSRLDGETLLYEFTVEDPETWTEPWSGEYPWPATAGLLYEYACHEGNHSMRGILRGARVLEQDASR